MKKTILLLVSLLLIVALLAGCGKAKPTGGDSIFVEINGQKVSLGTPFADVKDKLGNETQPAEVINSCDENSDWQQTMHFYDGVIVTEDKDGNIDSVQVNGGDPALMGKIRIGATKDDVKSVLGEPDTDESWGMYYEKTNPWVNLYIDEETGQVSGFALLPTMN